MNEEVDLFLDEYKEKLEKVLSGLRNEYSQIRAGRANPHVLDRVYVDYYGEKTPINQMASINIADARMLTVSVWDISQLKNVLKAINEANLGLSPSEDGKVIRLVFPPMNEERRRELCKEVSRISENYKVTCRNARRDILEEFRDMKKDGSLSEDELSSLEKEVQKILDSYTSEIDKMESDKTKDLMEL